MYRYNCNFVASSLRQSFTVTTVTMLLYPYGCQYRYNCPFLYKWRGNWCFSNRKKVFAVLSVVIIMKYWTQWLRFSYQLLWMLSDETRNIFKKDIRRLSNTYNFNTTKWRNPLILPVFACWKRMFRLKPANLEVVLCFWSLFCLVLFSLSDMHLNRSKF